MALRNFIFTLGLNFFLVMVMSCHFFYFPHHFGEASALAATGNPPLVKGEDLLAGKEISITAQNKKGLVLIFLSAKCPCSHSHLQELTDLAKEFPSFAFVGIHSNLDEGKNLSLPYFQNAKLPFPILEDQATKLADEYKALKTPHAFVVSASGELLYQGGVSDSKRLLSAEHKYLREALEDVMKGSVVRTKEGRTLGCVIERK
jgi:hypothetical protein